MGEYEVDGRPVAKKRDPLFKFLGGCAIVAVLVVALFLGCAWYVGWRLTRDPAAGRPPETFLTGGETRYWCIDLKPDDAGMQALFQNLHTIGVESQREAVKGTFLESFPLPRRRAHLAEVAPVTLEGSMFAEPQGWAVRATLSHQVLRMRATLKLMRWVMTHKTRKATTVDVDGIAVTEVRGNEIGFALANVGNRVLAASDASRMGQVLGASKVPPHPGMSALHGAIKLDGEDGWAFMADMEITTLSSPLSIASAVASFDVTEGDELRFRVAVSDAAAAPEGRAFRGSIEECGVVTAAFLPGFSAEAIEIDGEGAGLPVDGSRVFTGRIRDLTKRLPELPKRLGEAIVKRRASASPIPPSPPSSDGPRSDTPGAPMREGSPTPPR